jgi:hypothetical protein
LNLFPGETSGGLKREPGRYGKDLRHVSEKEKQEISLVD